MPIWPSKELLEEKDLRQKYIDALKVADKGNYRQLEAFTRKRMK